MDLHKWEAGSFWHFSVVEVPLILVTHNNASLLHALDLAKKMSKGMDIEVFMCGIGKVSYECKWTLKMQSHEARRSVQD